MAKRVSTFTEAVKIMQDYYEKETRRIFVESYGILAGRVIQSTPVLTGQLKGSWRSTVGSQAIPGGLRIDPEGVGPLMEVKYAVSRWNYGETLYMANLTPYAYKIEYEGWSSRKAPLGMLRINVADIDNIVSSVLRNSKQGV